MQTKANLFYYSLLSAILLIMEILIGKFVPSGTLLRDYGGDILVIPLIYCLIRIFIKILPKTMPLLVCGIGFLTELTQYFHLSDKLGFARGSLISILLGTSFSWLDLLCYIIGMLLIYAGILIKLKCKHNF